MIADELLKKTAMMLSYLMGWDFPPDRWNDLNRGIIATAKDLGIKSTPDAISTWLSTVSWNQKEIELLTTHLTVGETYFFREKAGLEVFQKQIIPELIKLRQGNDQFLRIWCAGCCSGEEPLTIAILLNELIPDIQNWSITILATDINRVFLKKAQTGIYTPWSFRETPQSLKNRYFSQAGPNWQINSRIRDMVSFEFLNLAGNQYPSADNNTNNMDVIFCRNVLMYFTPHQIIQAANRFYDSLTENGWLITSAVEMNDEYFTKFDKIRLEQSVFYCKVPATATAASSIVSLPRTKPAGNKVIEFRKGAVRRSKPEQSFVAGKPSASGFSPVKNEEIPDLNEIRTLLEKKQYQRCIDHCHTWVAKMDIYPEICMMLIKSYANLGNLSEAIKWGDKLLLMVNPGADAYNLVATILLENNSPELAESLLKRALFLDPHNLLSHLLMGNIAQREGRKSSAVKHFQNVNELLAKGLSTTHER